MDNQTLQRLMIDDALGALEPDVRALLSAHTATHPPDQAEHALWQQLADTARQVAPVASSDAIPPLPHGRLRAIRLMQIGRTTLALAAAILIGLAVGLHLPQQGSSVAPQAVATPSPLAAPLAPVAASSPTDFWSSKRLLASAMAYKPEPPSESRSEFRAGPSLHWPSLLPQPTGVQ